MIRLLSLFSGIGAPEKALKNLGIDYDLVAYSEIDKHASKAYSLIHGVPQTKNLGDITKIDTSNLPEDIDLITYGYPCQDISVAGKQRGFTDENGNRTRSGLFFEALRIIQDTQPKVAIAENVKALTGKKFAAEFKIVLDSLNEAGYNNYWKVLNAKDYGIPQNRERVFIVSIRKDLDNGEFIFPAKQELNLRLKDILEKNVDEKYYLKDTKQFFINNSLLQESKGNGFRFAPHIKNNAHMAKTITTRSGDRMDDNFILDNAIDTSDTNFVFNKENIERHTKALTADPVIAASRGRYTESGETAQKLEPNMTGVSNTLTTVQKDNLVIEPNIGHNPVSKKLEFDGFRTDVSPCLIATDYKAPKCTMTQDMRIRKLTPKECWRLMGFADADIDSCISAGISNTQLYKQAGNSIVVNVLENLFKNILTILDR